MKASERALNNEAERAGLRLAEQAVVFDDLEGAYRAARNLPDGQAQRVVAWFLVWFVKLIGDESPVVERLALLHRELADVLGDDDTPPAA